LLGLSVGAFLEDFIARRAKEPKTSGFQFFKNAIDSIFFCNYKIASWFFKNSIFFFCISNYRIPSNLQLKLRLQQPFPNNARTIKITPFQSSFYIFFMFYYGNFLRLFHGEKRQETL
jgi:hypothetical protein